MTYEEKQNRWKSFSDNELNIISSALYSQLQYSYSGEASFVYQQIVNEIARRRTFMCGGISGTNYLK